MTRNQLIEKRKRKKRAIFLRRAGIAAGAVVVLLLLIFAVIPGVRRGATSGGSSATVSGANAAKTDTDTAQTVEATSDGQDGWNLDDTGWWYKNSDGTKFASGWKTIDGQRYYFKDDGYMATGWVNTGNVSDDYFNDAGILDPTKHQKLVALTYDDGPSKNTDTILDVLKQYNAKATFFVVGQQAEYYTSELQREVNEGMEVGSHTYEHMTLKYHTTEEIQETLNHNDEVIQRLAGFTPVIMRPTGGGVDENVATSVTKPMIEWDVDTEDWKTKDAANTVKVAEEHVQDGSIILMHDLYEATAEASKTLIPDLQKMGYKMVTVSELAETYGYKLETGGLYFDFYPGGTDDNKSPSELIAAIQNGYSA